MNIKALALATVTVAASLTAAPAAEARGTYAEHTQLGNAIRSTGVVLNFNSLECNDKDAMGWYWSVGNEMVICQENRFNFSTREVQWTEEDLDTLRHEAQHLVQDCMDGARNGRLGSVYQDPIALAKNTLSQGQVKWIVKEYTDANVPEHVIVMELEAFSVAVMNNPAEQTRDIRKFCF